MQGMAFKICFLQKIGEDKSQLKNLLKLHPNNQNSQQTVMDFLRFHFEKKGKGQENIITTQKPGNEICILYMFSEKPLNPTLSIYVTEQLRYLPKIDMQSPCTDQCDLYLNLCLSSKEENF